MASGGKFHLDLREPSSKKVANAGKTCQTDLRWQTRIRRVIKIQIEP
jgi:hypothetical protein